MEKDKWAFHLEEYKSLKSEVEYRVKATETIEYTVAVAIAALYAWFSQNNIGTALWWLPPLLAAIGLIREIALLTRLNQITGYLLALENYLADTALGGWEHSLKRIRKSPKGLMVSGSSFIFWLVILAVTCAIALKGGFKG